MPIQFNEEHGGKLLVVNASGTLTKTDYEIFVSKFEGLVQEHGKLRVMFDMAEFHGWDAGALWADIRFDIQHFGDIERIAMIGDKRWQHGMSIFCRLFTKAVIRYFDHADAVAAGEWLGEGLNAEPVGVK